ncbi:protein RarD [Roseibium sp. TrichSKD4]|uniref:EamA family transporter RarD n=1 Tax=Roseibium sp. TrichSKD4 TaxID=744980 RepID=UPI0001E570FE|nr:EamA family transporter RarD [Roseibium sp. TrichSKD4]EFO29576.1 protein RarD [Roseibium sp. TrichSKD4]
MADATPTGKSPPAAQDEMQRGILLALAAYGMWGFFPAYYKLTASVSADIVVAHRIVWSVFFVGLYLLLRNRGAEIWEALTAPAIVFRLCASAALIGVNWLVFVWAIGQSKVLDVSLGYFINPLVSILIGLIVLRERLYPLQMIAVGLASVAVFLQALWTGGLPWVSLVLAFSFAGYAYVRKVTPVRPTPGLLAESTLLVPLAAGYLMLTASWGMDSLSLNNLPVLAALAGTGIITALPLIAFSGAARRLPMVIIGIMQYIAPSLHFVMAVFIWNEPLESSRLVTFLIIWTALAIFTFDSYRRYQASRRKAALEKA